MNNAVYEFWGECYRLINTLPSVSDRLRLYDMLMRYYLFGELPQWGYRLCRNWRELQGVWVQIFENITEEAENE